MPEEVNGITLLRLTPKQRDNARHLACADPEGPAHPPGRVLYAVLDGQVMYIDHGLRVELGEGQAFDALLLPAFAKPTLEWGHGPAGPVRVVHVCGESFVTALLSYTEVTSFNGGGSGHRSPVAT